MKSVSKEICPTYSMFYIASVKGNNHLSCHFHRLVFKLGSGLKCGPQDLVFSHTVYFSSNIKQNCAMTKQTQIFCWVFYGDQALTVGIHYKAELLWILGCRFNRLLINCFKKLQNKTAKKTLKIDNFPCSDRFRISICIY